MDLLATLNVPSLPEQQTRLSHHPNVARVLSSDSGRTVRLGFDACCTCARDLPSPSTTEKQESKVEEKKKEKGNKKRERRSTSKVVECKRCRRVRYCSDECRRMDADPNLRPIGSDDNDCGGDDGDSAEGGGHGGVVCSLLRLCGEDEAVDDRWHGDGGTTEAKIGGGGEADASAAEDRVRSEYESYPATLANALLDAPCCRDVLRRVRRRRIGTLVVHIVGASYGAEIWRKDGEGGGIGLGDVRDAYAEALAEVVDSQRKLESIDLVFVGPDCPADTSRFGTGWSKSKAGGALTSMRTVKRSKDGGGSGDLASSPCSSCRVTFHLHRCDYEDYASGRTARGTFGRSTGTKAGGDHGAAPVAPRPPAPDVVVLFNPGFTCPDYSWEDAVRSLTLGAALLVTSNTEMEAVLDCRFLHERGRVGGTIPPEVMEMMDMSPSSSSPPPPSVGACVDGGEDEGSAASSSFFGENPFAGSRVRQSGNMANDLFVKNGWMFGCVIGSGNKQGSELEVTNGHRRGGGGGTASLHSLQTGKRTSGAEAQRNGCEEQGTSSKRRAKRHKVKGSGNSKKKNPALI